MLRRLALCALRTTALAACASEGSGGGRHGGPRGPAPKLGQHTREVLLEAGLTEAEVDVVMGVAAAPAG